MSLFDHADLIVVGAGLYGLTIAERAASNGHRVVVIDKRPHIGGNAFSYRDDSTNIEIHKYGPHFFHTNNEEVFTYLSNFTDWYPFELRVWSASGGKIYPMPINLGTICSFLNRYLSPGEARKWVEESAKEIAEPRNLEEKAISLIGRPLYEAFIRGYTKKQWQTDPRDLPAETIARLPVRFTFDSRYFNDKWQYMPKDGYGALFEKMAAHPNISLRLNVDWRDCRQDASKALVVYTGAIDGYFDYRLGALGWRTLDFEAERLKGDFQGCVTVNYADETVPWTRIVEYKHVRPETVCGDETIIMREFSRSAGRGDEPYYPINTSADKNLYASYVELARRESNVFFGGRLGGYSYLDMHQVVNSALKAFESKIGPRLGQCRK